jgi:hypothetical protein
LIWSRSGKPEQEISREKAQKAHKKRWLLSLFAAISLYCITQFPP